jgi:hypothetical protein
MSALRHIAILAFMVLVTGCTDYDCPGPGYPSFPNCPTNFLFKVVAVDSSSGQVDVVYPKDLPEDRQPGINQTVTERVRNDPNYEKHKIYVRDLKMLVETGRLKVGSIYVFHNGNGSPFFEVFPEGYELFTQRQYK